MLNKPWVIVSELTRRPCYQLVEDCTYWPVLGSIKNWNMIQFTNKTTINENFYSVNKVVLDGISDNISALFQNGKYGVINNADPTIMGYYVVKFLSEPYTLKDNKTVEKQVTKAGELILKEEYISTMKSNTNWYWKQLVTKEGIIIETRTIYHLCLYV